MPDEYHDKTAFLLLGVILVFFAGSLLLLKYTGINLEFFLTPTSSIYSVIKGNIDISWTTIALFIFCLAVSLCFLILYTLKHEPNLIMSIVMVVMAAFVFIFFGFTSKNLYAFFGVFLALFAASYFAHSDVEHYKKISAYKITNSSLRNGFLIVNLFLAISVFTLLNADSTYADQELQGFMKSTANINISDIDNIQQQLMQEQEQAAYSMLEAMETALLYSIYTAPELTVQDKATCFTALNNSMTAIDTQAKEQIKSSMGEVSPQMGQFDAIKNMLDSIIKYYPIITALTFFFMMNLISKIAILIASMLSSLFWRFFSEES